MARRLWDVVDGEPFMVNPYEENPALALWGANPRHRRRSARAHHKRHRSRRRGGYHARRRHRVHGYSYSRRGRRVHVHGHMSNPRPHRRHRSRRSYRHNARRSYAHNVGGAKGTFDIMGLLPTVGVYVGGALAVSMGAPYLARMIGWPPMGWGYRGLQAVTAMGAGWAAHQFKILRPGSAIAFTSAGLAVVALGIISDYMSGMLTAPAAAAPAGVTGMGYYRTSGGNPQFVRGLGYVSGMGAYYHVA